jgi:Tol biopolymer transport system component
MPDIREVYEMITKQKPPEPGALERQQRRQVRAARNRRLGGYAVAAMVGLVAVVALILGRQEVQNATTPADEPPTASDTTSGPFLLDITKGDVDPAILTESGPSDRFRAGERTPLPGSLAGGLAYVPSPDGTKVVYGTGENGGCVGGEVTMVANIDGTDVQMLPAAPEGLNLCGARWSPDGTKLVFQARNGTDPYDVGDLFVQDLATGRWTQVTDLSAHLPPLPGAQFGVRMKPELTRAFWWFLSPSFSDDGKNVVFHLPRDPSETTTWNVWSVRATGGEYARRPYTLVLRNAAFPMLNRADVPEGDEIAFVLPATDVFAGNRIMTARPDPWTDIRATLVEANDSIWWPTRSPDGQKIAYQDGGSIYVVEIGPVVRGEYSKVANGKTAEWLDNDTLIVAP